MNTVELAKRVRVNAVKMVNKGGSSHIGSVLSIADILAVLYGDVLKFQANNPKWDCRDRFILSKGHAGAGVYAVLAECGFIPMEWLEKHYQNGSFLSGHVSHKGISGVELSTGSLGHGLPIGAGMAYAAKLEAKKHRVYILLGDGECDEGSNWESILFASHHQLNNLIAIIDRNNLQSMDTTENTLSLEPLADKWQAFGWQVTTVNGHDHAQLIQALKKSTNKPHCIIANTIKGKGVSYMENQVAWHYKTPKGQEFEQALQELEEAK
jgi:transketolase